MSLKPMDPRILQAVLEGQEDCLTELQQKEDEYVRNLRCPHCQGDTLSTEIDVRRPFSPGKPLPNYLCRCGDCRCLFAPYTYVIVEPPEA